ncbi:TonB-dependent siderophore receptor [Flavobacterium cucumis]|uniref:Iron complex outermembrane recepter protein n=1 Tax=Flavobacterium cucumis TaxID=416016 RepID=A0A1M7ZYZ5_9FLAO|nr:TonB-dependent receptor [Flavobacterium cucumis]SHO73837.1 iron complex outermembrane recepter protein [Flavobacterium cucumis]
MKKLVVFFLSLSFCFTFSQEVDSLKTKELKEVLVVGTKAALHEKQTKTLATLDEFLQKSTKVDLIKRGAYAWEPIINGMATERTVVTIDGMRIFGACTDKMDPVTSYFEVSNLSEATISSGQQGSCHGNTIGGSIDLKRSQRQFTNAGWEFFVNSGYETNNRQKIIGSAINYADSLFYVDTDVMFRDAENYRAGNNKEIEFSQFRKLNLSATSGYKLASNKNIEASVIFDRATDVGYPALPMDVSLAEALITSVKFNYKPSFDSIDNWETKLYFNTITHTMDDTKRPDVPIHMDMPGWSDTYGFYSKINGKYKKHQFLANLNSFYNRSVAEMTMYPSDPNENLMFMYTWPDVRTLYSGIYLEDNYEINCHSNIKTNANLGFHNNNVASDFGLQSLQIFYPEMQASKSRFLKSISTNYFYNKDGISYGFGMGYGERAPSVSEGYGFYLFNSFDGFDYIGNPNLKNEKSLEGNANIGFKNSKWQTKISASYFHIYDYIIGIPDASVAPMTIGANGVKIYTALDFATILSADFTVSYQLSDFWIWKGQFVYNLGKDNENNGLPFMSPFNYMTSLSFRPGKFSSELQLKGNATQTEYNAFYGEDKTPDYAIVNANFGYKFTFEKSKMIFNTGVENLLDANYTTYTDWNNLPRMGRNIFMNLMFQF